MIYYQGHCAPGIYARSFLEGRLTEEHLNNFRREVGRCWSTILSTSIFNA
jgi:pyruvate dehydrogenase E1 component